MAKFSALVPETCQDVSSGFAEMLIQTQREELFTGLMRLSHTSGENLLFTALLNSKYFVESSQSLLACRTDIL